MKLCLPLFALIILTSAFAANPGNFEENTGNAVIEFESAANAEKSILKTAPLYNNKKLAVSARWDDTNPKHLNMAETMKKGGWKGTFYLVNPHDGYYRRIVPCLLKNGCGIGSHTMTHASLPNLNSNDMFRECMESRIRLEANTDTPVLGLVTPGVVMSLWISGDRKSSSLLGEALQRCGYIGGAEFTRTPEKTYGLSADTWFGGRIVCPGDRGTTMEKFSSAFEKAVAEELKKTEPLPVVIGVHVWMKDDNFPVYESCFRKYAGNPDWWYCEMNEYQAYRYRAANAEIKPGAKNGNSKTFRITLIRPREFSTKLPVTFVSSEKMKSVTINGVRIPVSADGKTFHWNGDGRTVKKIGMTENGAESAKFPGIKAKLSIDKSANKLNLELENGSQKELSDLTVVLHLPMRWKQGNTRFKLDKLAVGEKKNIIHEMGARHSEYEFNKGELFFTARIDFLSSGESGRLYAIYRIQQPFRPGNTPHDNARLLGPLPETPDTLAFLKKSSIAGTSLNDFGTKINEKWVQPEANPRSIPVQVSLSVKTSEWKKEAKAVNKAHKDTLRAVAMDISAPETGEYRLFSRRDMKYIFLNGESVTPAYAIKVRLKKGISRFIVVFPKNTPREAVLSTAKPDADLRNAFLETLPLTPR